MRLKKHNFIFDLVLILLTAGLWNIWMQYRQIRDYNRVSNEKKYSFLKWMILTLITFGFYHVYHEYKLTKSICEKNNIKEKEIISIIAAIISITGFWVFVDLYQQEILNQIVSKIENEEM